ncbi:hypothetical protein [Lactococcus allomyrinae]|nr:hypothetical protein [Lactococcus allomyrinae]
MWVVQITSYKLGKRGKCHRHYFENKSEAEDFANQQHQRTEIYKLEKM